MFDGELLPDGRVRVPKRAEGPEGEVGDATVVLSPGDDGYEGWAAYLRERRSADDPGAVTLEEARATTAGVMPSAELGQQCYADDTYWLVPAYVPDDELRPDSPVPVVRKDDGRVEWLLPHLPPVVGMRPVVGD